MKMTSTELRALALRSGAEVVIDGKRFNTGRAQVASAPAAPKLVATAPEPAAPPAPAAQTFTRAEVELMLAEQETRLLQRLVALIPKQQAAEPDEDDLQPIGFNVKYRQDGAIEFVGVEYARLQ